MTVFTVLGFVIRYICIYMHTQIGEIYAEADVIFVTVLVFVIGLSIYRYVYRFVRCRHRQI